MANEKSKPVILTDSQSGGQLAPSTFAQKVYDAETGERLDNQLKQIRADIDATSVSVTALEDAMKNIQASKTFSHSKTETVHYIVNSNVDLSNITELVSCKAKMTADYTAGDTIQINGTTVTIVTNNGEALGDKAWVKGAVICFEIDAKNVYFTLNSTTGALDDYGIIWEDSRIGTARVDIRAKEPIIYERYGDIAQGENAGILGYDEESFTSYASQPYIAMTLNHEGTLLIALHSSKESANVRFSVFKINKTDDRISFLKTVDTGFSRGITGDLTYGSVEFSKKDNFLSVHDRITGRLFVFKVVKKEDGTYDFLQSTTVVNYVACFHWSTIDDSYGFYISNSTGIFGSSPPSNFVRMNNTDCSNDYLYKMTVNDTTSNWIDTTLSTSILVFREDFNITDGMRVGDRDSNYQYNAHINSFSMLPDESGLFFDYTWLKMWNYQQYKMNSSSEIVYYYRELEHPTLVSLTAFSPKTLKGSSGYPQTYNAGYEYLYRNVYFYDVGTKKTTKLYGGSLYNINTGQAYAQQTLPAMDLSCMVDSGAIQYIPDKQLLLDRNRTYKNDFTHFRWQISKITFPEDKSSCTAASVSTGTDAVSPKIAVNWRWTPNKQGTYLIGGCKGNEIDVQIINSDGTLTTQTTVTTAEGSDDFPVYSNALAFSDDGMYLCTNGLHDTKKVPRVYKFTPKAYVKPMENVFATAELTTSPFTEYGIGVAKEYKPAGEEINVNLFPALNVRLGGKIGQ